MNRLSKFLLASTCLTAVNVAAAQAVTVPEVEPNDSFLLPQTLPPGTTEVSPADFTDIDSDHYRLALLQPGAPFSATIFSSDDTSVLFEEGFAARTSSGTLIDSENSVANGSQVSGIIPADGILAFDLFGSLEEGSYNYTLNINAPVAEAPPVPEPSVVSLLASGVAGLGALRALRRKRQTS